MARKRKKQLQKQKALQARRKKNRPSARLAEAHAAVAQDNLVYALQLAQDALHGANDDQTIQRGRVLVAELHFRLAAEETSLQGRLNHLEQGEAVASQDRRFPYYRGLVLLVLQQPEAALQALVRAREIAPKNPETAMLIAFAQTQTDPTSVPEKAPETVVEMLDLLTTVGREQLGQHNVSEDVLASLPGGAPTLWHSLLTMATDPKSSCAAGLDEKATEDGPSLAKPLLDYYAGVAALRRNDHDTAVAAWQSALKSGLDTPWFQRNRLYLLRQTAEQAATQEAWQDVVDLLEGEPLAKVHSPLQELLGYGYFHLGTREAEAQRWSHAAAHWRRANALTPSRNLAQNLALVEELNENWSAAAQAWRDMVRRRPRKADHPDYLDERQVAMIWLRAADCYDRAFDVDEKITCLSKAIEYVPDNLAWRMQLVSAYRYEEREDAAENELLRILDIDDHFMPALLELADLYEDRWDRKATPIWRRAVAADGANEAARDGLARALIAEAESSSPSFYRNLLDSRRGSTVKKLDKALAELPDHPLLLLELGKVLDAQGKSAKARERLRQAGRIAGQKPADNLGVLGDIMHELLHADGGEYVPELMDLVRSLPNLRATYWLEQADLVMGCELDSAWADRFWQEALTLSQRRPNPDTPAFVLLKIISSIDDYDLQSTSWADKYVENINTIAPDCGLEEYVAALEVRDEDMDKAQRLLRKAKRHARSTGETAVVEYLEMIEGLISGAFRSPLDALFASLDEDEIEALLEIADDGPGAILDIFRQGRL